MPRWWWITQPSDCLAVEGKNVIGEMLSNFSCQKSERQNSTDQAQSNEVFQPVRADTSCWGKHGPNWGHDGVKEPFWLAVVSLQCVEGGWCPHKHNALNEGREEGVTEVRWRGLGRASGRAQRTTRSCCMVIASLPNTLHVVSWGIPRSAAPTELRGFSTWRPQPHHLTLGCHSSC